MPFIQSEDFMCSFGGLQFNTIFSRLLQRTYKLNVYDCTRTYYTCVIHWCNPVSATLRVSHLVYLFPSSPPLLCILPAHIKAAQKNRMQLRRASKRPRKHVDSLRCAEDISVYHANERPRPSFYTHAYVMPLYKSLGICV